MVMINPASNTNGSSGEYHLVVSNPGRLRRRLPWKAVRPMVSSISALTRPINLKTQSQGTATLTVWPATANPAGKRPSILGYSKIRQRKN